MRARHARPTRLQDRIVGFFVVLLLAVQLVSFLFIRYAIERTAQGTMRDELRVGARVFTRLLEQNSRQLADATSVLTYDFGFREAIATRDRATILSTLRNHAARIKANGMAVIGLDGRVVADTIQEGMAGKPYPFPDLVARAADLGRTSGVRVVDGKAYQIIVVPVLAPLPIAWVSISFVIDDATARDLQRITTSDISFVQMAGGAPHILATTLPPLRRASFVPEAGRIIAIAHDGATVRLGDDDYEVLARPIDDTGSLPIHAILQRLSADGLIAYRALEVVLLIIASLSLAVMLVGARRITGRITRPVALLGAAAIEIERGNYSVRVASEASDEIGELGRAFDRMAAGLAERDNMRDVLGKVASNEVVTRLLEGGDIELGGEERDVTVMFTDIRNFTALVEKLTPDQSLQLLNQFLTVISEVIEAHGGVVDKYIGDGVNLAARLEGLTKRYHVPIVVGYATREKARDIVCRELDKVRVRGKTVPERIFEPLAREGELTATQVVHLAQWNEALEMFRLRCWDAAAAAFKELATVPGYERITFLYLGYIRDLEANPPGENWDAAFTLYEK